MRAFLVPAIEAAFIVHELCTDDTSVDVDTVIATLRHGPIERSQLDYENGRQIINQLSMEFLTESRALPAVSRWRIVLRQLTILAKPIWAVRLPQGRENTIAAMDVDTVQCLRYAELIDRPLDDEGVAWWDGLAAEIRRVEDQRRLMTGRIGERLSLDHERKRLAPFGLSEVVQWMALENNALGYDIISGDVIADEFQQRCIEVKACQFSPPQFYMSRNEWEVAKEKREAYVVHVWSLTDNSLQLIDFDELSTHVPFDSSSGKGLWNKVKVSL